MKIVEIKNISKVYSNGKKALNDISLSVEKGEFIALLGPNGAGKSTLINIIADVVRKTSGQLISCGFDFDIEKNNFKRTFGIVPQEINADPFSTAYESLKFQQGIYGLPFDKKKIMDILESMGLTEQAHVSSRALSGGMKRRLLVAKAIIHDPEIIILDEPTAGVDVDLRQHLWAFLKDLNQQGKTIILTTHYLEEAEHLCDKIAIINKGQLIRYENKKDLIDKVGSKVLEIEFDQDVSGFGVKLTNHDYSVDNNKLIVEYNEGSEVGQIIKELVAQGLSIQNLNNKVSSLEEVFLKLTR